MSDLQWQAPEDAVCAVEGCALPCAAVRPTTESYTLENALGQAIQVFPAGSIDEGVCQMHAEEREPDESV